MACLGMRVRLDRKAIVLCQFFHFWIERGALGATDSDLFRIADRSKRVVVQVQGYFGGSDWRMFAEDIPSPGVPALRQ